MVVEDGRYTGEIDFYAYGEYKAEAMRALAAEHGYDLAESYAYSDSATDLPMLEAVGHPFAVNPDKALRKVGDGAGLAGAGLRATGPAARPAAPAAAPAGAGHGGAGRRGRPRGGGRWPGARCAAGRDHRPDACVTQITSGASQAGSGGVERSHGTDDARWTQFPPPTGPALRRTGTHARPNSR